MMVPFVKATACGNDFLIIDMVHAPADIRSFTRRICDRHNGVGADGVEWVVPAKDADLGVRLLNADGSEAEISGNGTRCVAAWYCAEHQRDSVVIRTGAGLKTCELTSRNGSAFEFRSSMGVPEVGDEFPIKLTYGERCGVPVSMGNPHYVVFVSEFELGWQAVAEQISKHHDFKYGMNVELVRVMNAGRDRGALLRARCGRDHVIGNRLLRRGRGLHSYRQSQVAGAGARSRRNPNRGMERRSLPVWTGHVALPRRVLRLTLKASP